MKLKNCAHALELLQRTDPLIAAEAIDQHITITHQPGGMASLTAGEDPPWNITITVDSNGILQTKGDTFQLVNMTLPNPALIGRETPEGTLGIKHLIRSIANNRIATLLTELYEVQYANAFALWQVGNAVTQWTNKMPRQTATRIRAATRYAEFENAVRQLLNQDAWNLAKDNKGKTFPKRYNRAITAAAALQDLAHTNPGAASWIISQDQPAILMSHPSEVVHKVKDRASKAGVESRYWKTLTNMSTATMELLLQKHVPQYATALIINACGDVQCLPNKQQAANAVTIFCICRRKADLIRPPQLHELPEATRARERLRHIIRLIMKPGGPDTDLTTDFATLSYVMDYTANLIDTDQDITAQSYNGLMKAARRWHQTEQQAIAAALVQEQIDRQAGWFPCWNSLVDTTTIPNPQDPEQPDITVVPLTTTHALLEEGRHMKHCVAVYTNSCTDGQARIFSIRQGTATLATTELALKAGKWHVAQTRAWRNGEASERAHHAVKILVRAYRQRWAETHNTPKRHHAWLQHPETGETKAFLSPKKT